MSNSLLILKRIIFKAKRIASVPFLCLNPSETELDDPSSKIYADIVKGNALPQAKTIDLLQTMKKNLTQTSKISSDSEYSSSDGEVYIPKRKVYEYENKIINQKKKIKTLQNEMEVLKSRNAYLETDYDTLKEKLNRYESNAGIEESSCKEMLKVLLQETTEIKASLKTTLEEAFKDRLKKQQYHDVTIAAELKLVNRYIAEKINDVRKCKSRRN
ncbi:Histone H4 [Armadillidium vulgare]|nr:Histone H4 [Armadillidium vulgare]